MSPRRPRYVGRPLHYHFPSIRIERGIPPFVVVAAVVVGACAQPVELAPVPTTAPRLVWSPPLAYPPAMVQAGIEGTVLLEALVDTTGKAVPSTIRVIRSTRQTFETPAMVLLRESQFAPGRTGAELAEVLVRVPVVFELEGGRIVSLADSASAASLVRQAERLASDGRIDEAMSLYRRAQALDSRAARSPLFWLPLCWYGTLWEQAADVLWTCDHVVGIAPTDRWAREARGIARALTGDPEGAITDLSMAAGQMMSNEERSERLAWVGALRAGRNPFSPEVLASLRSTTPGSVP